MSVFAFAGGFSEENWEEEMRAHPFFNSEGWKEGEELSPIMQVRFVCLKKGSSYYIPI